MRNPYLFASSSGRAFCTVSQKSMPAIRIMHMSARPFVSAPFLRRAHLGLATLNIFIYTLAFLSRIPPSVCLSSCLTTLCYFIRHFPPSVSLFFPYSRVRYGFFVTRNLLTPFYYLIRIFTFGNLFSSIFCVIYSLSLILSMI